MAKIELVDQSKDFYQKLTKQQKIIAGSVIGSVFFAIIFILISSSIKEEWGVLFSSLNEKEAGKIIEKLKEKKIDYKLENNGTTILVHKDKNYDIRLDMANEGLPEDGIAGYELFDQTNLGMSEFVQKLNYRRALEGELARTISANDEIMNVRVHIVIPETTLFEKDQKKPTASVMLKLKTSKSLGRISVEGIQNLVSGSIEGMNPHEVTIVNNRGKILSPKKIDENSIAGLTARQHQQQMKIESYLSNKVQSLLDGMIGVGNSEVRVNTVLDFTQREKTETLYDYENQALRSEQNIQESSQSTDSLSYPAVNMSKEQTNAIANYEVPKTIKRTIESVGNIKKLTIGIIINSLKVVKNKETGHKEIGERKIDSEKLVNVIKDAVGWNTTDERDDRIHIFFTPFETFAEDYENAIQQRQWWKEPDYIKLFALIASIIATLIIIFRLLQSKYIKNRIRIAFELPESISLEDDEVEDDEVEEEELEEIILDEEELMLVPAELPEQLLLDGDIMEQEYEEFEEIDEEEFDRDSLAARATAGLDEGEASDLSENAMMKLELKAKVESFFEQDPVDGVRLIRYFIAQDLVSKGFNI